MRGDDSRRDGLFSYVRSEDRVPKGHPLRVIRQLANQALDALSPRFDELYAPDGRPSIPPEAARPVAAGVLFDPLGTAADGTAELQSVVPLVCRPVGG